MPKYSVKKPFTVLVAVAVILVFGVIAYRNMTPDLMPNMDYPYVVVLTSYPGAAPETVEAEVSKPLEQAMATLNNIKDLRSSSAEGYSTVLLEFEQDASMDSIMVDILQALQPLTDGWDDSIGTPYLMRINPSMLPVMVAAVDREGMDRLELCRFADETVIPALEGTTGLAEVSAGGLVEQTLTVRLSKTKIAAANERVAQALTGELADAKKKLDDAQAEIDSSRAALAGSEKQLQSAQSSASGELGAGSLKLDETVAQYQAYAAQLGAAQAQKKALETEKSLYAQNLTQLQGSTANLQSTLDTVRSTRSLLSPLLALAVPDETPLSSLVTDPDALAALTAQGCSTLGDARALDGTLAANETELAAALAEAQTAQAQLQAKSDARTPQIEAELANLDTELAVLQSITDQYAAAIGDIRSGYSSLQSGLLSAAVEISSAGARIAAAQSGLDNAQTSLDAAYDSYHDQVDAALKAADLNGTVTLQSVSALLGAQNFEMPAGTVDDGGVSCIVTVGDALSGAAELEDLVLFDLNIDGLDPIRLSDVADVTASDNADSIYATLNGNDGLILTFSKQSNYATARVSDNLRDKFADLSAQYPGLTFTPLMDQGEYIYLVRDSIVESLLWGALFAVLILFAFLQDWRPTLITLCSIPISLLFAVALMYFTGVSINIMSLSGLAISVGMLVDNSIVVIENTYRLRALGESAVKAAVSGARQVAGAIAASTITTICVFLPIVFDSGITRQLFTDMILTLSYALLASLFIALTLVPAMAGKLLTRTRPPRQGRFARFLTAYRQSVRWAVGHKAAVLLTALALLLASGTLVVLRGFSFLPQLEMEQLAVYVTMPEGSSFAETAAMADEVTARILSVDGVGTVGGLIGSSGSGASGMSLSSWGEGDVSYYVLLAENTSRKGSAVAADIQTKCADLDCTVRADSNSLMSAYSKMLSGSGITVRVYSNDLDALQQAAGDVAARLLTVEGVTSSSSGIEDPTPVIHFTVDKDAAMKYGLTVAQVYAKVAEALNPSARVLELPDGDAAYSVVVSAGEKLTPDAVRALSFSVEDRQGEEQTVALRDIASVEVTQTLSTIHRESQRRYLDVTAEVADGQSVTRVTDRAETAVGAVALPEGVTAEFSGERETILDALGDLMTLLGVGVLLVYLVMVAQFQSLKSPLIVMFTVPLAFTGGFLALLLCGMDINILSMLGMIMLVGVIVNNGIVLVDYVNQLRRGGMEQRAAIEEAAVTRLRPILMTSITTILGLLVMALGRSEATSLMQPLAVTCIGGLLYATVMTLYVVPVMYDALNKKPLYTVEESELELSDK